MYEPPSSGKIPNILQIGHTNKFLSKKVKSKEIFKTLYFNMVFLNTTKL